LSSAREPDDRHERWIAAAREQFERAGSDAVRLGGSSNPVPLHEVRAGGALPPRALSARALPILPGYNDLRALHRGGQGIVYQAVQQTTGRTVAIKVLREGPFAGPADRLRFEREVSILAHLNHRGIVGILDRGEASGVHYLVMDFVEGRALDRHAFENGLPLVERLKLFIKVCDAVSAAHLRGVIHRDLKPGNILVDAAGEPRVLDFGLAKSAADDSCDEPAATRTGQFVGSLAWASPEQAMGRHAEVDIRSDVYSLGVILYHLMTHQMPYTTACDLDQALANIRSAEPVRPCTLCREIDADLETIVLKSLAKEPGRRYQSVGELSRDIARALRGEPIEARRDSSWYVLSRTLRRHRLTVSIVAGFVVLCAASAIAMSVLYARSQRLVGELGVATADAQKEAAKAKRVSQFAQGMLSGIDPARAGAMDKQLMRSVLDEAAAKVDSDLADSPEVEAAIRNTIGKAYQAISEFPAAKRHLDKALVIRRERLGETHADTLESMDSLATLLIDMALYREAEILCQKIVDARTASIGLNHEATLLAMSNLSEAIAVQGHFANAAELDRKVLALRTQLLGPEHPHTLTSMNNLASNLMWLQQFDEAESLYLKVIATEKHVKGEYHPHTLRTMNNLGLMYQEQLKMDEAEKWHRETLSRRLQAMGENHLDTFESQANLAIVLRAKGQVAEAETMLRKLEESERRVLGPKHPFLGSTLFVLSSIHARRGEFAEAVELLNEVVAVYESSLSPAHVKMQTTRIALGTCYARMGKYLDAERILLTGYETLQGRADVSSDWRESSIRYLVNLYEEWDKAEPSSGKAEKAAHWRAMLPPPTSTTAPTTAPGS